MAAASSSSSPSPSSSSSGKGSKNKSEFVLLEAGSAAEQKKNQHQGVSAGGLFTGSEQHPDRLKMFMGRAYRCLPKTLRMVKSSRVHGGWLRKFEHLSVATRTRMVFSIFTPPPITTFKRTVDSSTPVLYWLSGLTCTDDNFAQKGGAFAAAARNRLCVVMPDTSPRGAGIEGEDDSWDFGTGAGFYVNATTEKYKKNYNMYTYVTQELPDLIYRSFDVNRRAGISGHSMGGHGAMVAYLRNPHLFQSCSAFAPICNPVACPWGKKAFTGYLGPEEEFGMDWRKYDSVELISKFKTSRGQHAGILVDQGLADNFYEAEQLKPEALVQAARAVGFPLEVRLRKDYDHSYFFISTFSEEHIEYHSDILQRSPEAHADFYRSPEIRGLDVRLPTEFELEKLADVGTSVGAIDNYKKRMGLLAEKAADIESGKDEEMAKENAKAEKEAEAAKKEAEEKLKKKSPEP